MTYQLKSVVRLTPFGAGASLTGSSPAAGKGAAACPRCAGRMFASLDGRDCAMCGFVEYRDIEEALYLASRLKHAERSEIAKRAARGKSHLRLCLGCKQPLTVGAKSVVKYHRDCWKALTR